MFRTTRNRDRKVTRSLGDQPPPAFIHNVHKNMAKGHYTRVYSKPLIKSIGDLHSYRSGLSDTVTFETGQLLVGKVEDAPRYREVSGLSLMTPGLGLSQRVATLIRTPSNDDIVSILKP